MYLSTIFKIQGDFFTGNVKATAVSDQEELMLWYIKHEMVTIIQHVNDVRTSHEYITLHQYFQMFTGAMKARCTYFDPKKMADEIYEEVTKNYLDHIDATPIELLVMKSEMKKTTRIWVNPNISEFTTENICDIL